MLTLAHQCEVSTDVQRPLIGRRALLKHDDVTRKQILWLVETIHRQTTVKVGLCATPDVLERNFLKSTYTV